MPLTRAHLKTFCGVRRSTAFLWLLTLGYVMFIVLGAALFVMLELPTEYQMRNHLRHKRADFLRKYPKVADSDLEDLIVEIVSAHNRGISAVNNVTMEPNWSFGQSIFFSGTIITTIGYGHVTPLSQGGKIFCIVYAIVGIPLTLILLTAYVERLQIPATLLLQFLNSKLGHLYQPFNIRMLHLSIVVAVVVIFFYLIPAGILSYVEPGWNYLDSLYYAFISLTTIGLGDYVPGDHPNQAYRALYKVLATLYLLLGLTFMMLMLSVFYDIPQLNIGLFFLLKSDEMTSDPEKMRLHAGTLGPKYTQQIDEPQVRHIKTIPHQNSSSPEENP